MGKEMLLNNELQYSLSGGKPVEARGVSSNVIIRSTRALLNGTSLTVCFVLFL